MISDYFEGNNLRKIHKVSAVNIPQFKAFIYNQQKDNNYIYDLMATIVLRLRELVTTNPLKQKTLDELELKHLMQTFVQEVIKSELDNEYNQMISSFSVYSVG